MGDTGPCGPCTEIYIDRTAAGRDRRRPGRRQACSRQWRRPAGDGNLEQLVFIQYNRDAAGTLTELPAPARRHGHGAGTDLSGHSGKRRQLRHRFVDAVVREDHGELSGIKYGGKFPPTNSVDPVAEAADEGAAARHRLPRGGRPRAVPDVRADRRGDCRATKAGGTCCGGSCGGRSASGTRQHLGPIMSGAIAIQARACPRRNRWARHFPNCGQKPQRVVGLDTKRRGSQFW